MFETLALIQANIGVDIVGVLLVFARLSAAIAFVPGFGEMYIPVRLKVAASVALSLIICPLVLKNFSGSFCGWKRKTIEHSVHYSVELFLPVGSRCLRSRTTEIRPRRDSRTVHAAARADRPVLLLVAYRRRG